MGFLEAFPPQFSDFVQFSLLDSCNSLIKLCEKGIDSMIDEQNDVMFTEYAETIVRFNQVNPIEDDSQYY